MKAKSKLKDNTIQYGKVEMTEDELQEARNPKIRTTMFLEEDLIRAYKREATRRGLKYQQLMREKLRSGLQQDSDVETRLKRLEAKVLKRA
jgi:predicted DNA binding CopG/RHH family protein